jgi:nucleoside 2-deoxyribosyltransferase
MSICSVIQPFDDGKFDKRFQQVYKPAIKAAGLEPYRVDEDLRADVPIDSIESGIRSASICLADITTDNPNVWYELGFAFAAGKPVVIVCSNEREGKYPFDIQHRAIIKYRVDAPDDFDVLRTKITKRIEALLEKGEALRQIADTEQVAPVAGLSQAELTVLAVLAGSVGVPDGYVSVFSVQQDAERAGLTKLGFALGVRRLIAKSFVGASLDNDHNGDQYDTLKVTSAGWDWIDANETRFVLRRIVPDREAPTNDDIPF